MEEIIDSTLLEYDKSTILLDLIKFHNGGIYVGITQNIDGDRVLRQLKINAEVLKDIISVLQSYSKQMPKHPGKKSKSYFSDDRQKSIIHRYLIGVPISDLALQFDCTREIIEQVLRNNEISIVEQSYKPEKKHRRYKKRRM